MNSQESSYSQEVQGNIPSKPKKPRGTVQVIIEKLVATLDKCKVSNRNAMKIIIAVLESCDLDVDTYKVSKTVQECRYKMREKMATKIKEVFPTSELSGAVLHWDGKLLPKSAGKYKIDRLAITVSAQGTEKLLSIPPLDKGTG